MAENPTKNRPKILILATMSGGYAGADSVGQLHTDYPTNTYILPVLCPCMFPEEFYMRPVVCDWRQFAPFAPNLS